ncbi:MULTISPECIES: Gp138 family membrane-puncturing spike protein [unclassified Aurantimonas]|uniref:Gp138 family membrane-puncturing spike protein n=1 Tax=unclassified Aurantimonas TaxID=2638230 RepID=UPI002E18C509|nr:MULTISPECIES: Gp138 family membrane-puncturing spike protein [unclassified Aurantimonas]MEC5289370.1 Gp138 family membrane-puncturing spike protein [Aurantimonas sp. C2-3-R2]MEC5410450.1 Gp138 family membrane-puncturing spike protein [Aurantimonas sp. C2-4-R8]
MGFGHPDKTNTSFEDSVRQIILAEREDAWGNMDGEIVAFDPQRQTATIRPYYKKRLAGVPTQVADLLDVPIEFPRGGSGAITSPVKVGDKVRLAPQMRDSSNYDESGAAFDVGSERSFSLSDMRATLIGGNSLSDPIQNFDDQNTHIRFSDDGSFGLRGSPDGKFKIEGAQGNLYDILATFMELVASDQLSIAYGSSAGSGHALQNRAALMDLAAKVRAMAL